MTERCIAPATSEQPPLVSDAQDARAPQTTRGENLRVLHIVSGDLWGGAEAQAYALLSSLSAMPGTPVLAALMNEGDLAERLRAQGIDVVVFNERGQQPLRILFGLATLMRKWQPDIVHTHRAKENILGSLAILLAGGGIPCVRTVHGASEHSPEGVLAGVRRRVIGFLDYLCARYLQQRTIAVSAELGAQLAVRLPGELIVVIENGVDAVQLRSQAGVADFRRLEPEATHVGIVGRLVGVKRVDLFLAMAALLQRDVLDRNWRFHVFGDGPMRHELSSLCERLGIAALTTFHGHRSDIATCIASVDVIVMCSDHEGMPMTALEAAALGVPVVAHAVGGLVQVVAEPLLVSTHEADGYKDAVCKALSVEGRCAAERLAGQVTGRLSSAENARRIKSVYEAIQVEPKETR